MSGSDTAPPFRPRKGAATTGVTTNASSTARVVAAFAKPALTLESTLSQLLGDLKLLVGDVTFDREGLINPLPKQTGADSMKQAQVAYNVVKLTEKIILLVKDSGVKDVDINDDSALKLLSAFGVSNSIKLKGISDKIEKTLKHFGKNTTEQLPNIGSPESSALLARYADTLASLKSNIAKDPLVQQIGSPNSHKSITQYIGLAEKSVRSILQQYDIKRRHITQPEKAEAETQKSLQAFNTFQAALSHFEKTLEAVHPKGVFKRTALSREAIVQQLFGAEQAVRLAFHQIPDGFIVIDTKQYTRETLSDPDSLANIQTTDLKQRALEHLDKNAPQLSLAKKALIEREAKQQSDQPFEVLLAEAIMAVKAPTLNVPHLSSIETTYDALTTDGQRSAFLKQHETACRHILEAVGTRIEMIADLSEHLVKNEQRWLGDTALKGKALSRPHSDAFQQWMQTKMSETNQATIPANEVLGWAHQQREALLKHSPVNEETPASPPSLRGGSSAA